MSEHGDQVYLFTFIEMYKDRYPDLKGVFAIPNGGLRTKFQGKWLVDEGMRKGVPDVMCIKSVGEFRGLVIEMKFGKNKQTKEQKEWQDQFEQNGWLYLVCKSGDEAIRKLFDYLRIDHPFL